MDTPSNTPEQGDTSPPTIYGIASTTINVRTYATSRTCVRIIGPFGITKIVELTDPAQIDALRQMTTDKDTHGYDE